MSTKRKQKEIVGFKAWFEAQFGKRPNAGGATDAQVREMAVQGYAASIELDERTLWDEKRASALSAWTAKERGQK